MFATVDLIPLTYVINFLVLALTLGQTDGGRQRNRDRKPENLFPTTPANGGTPSSVRLPRKACRWQFDERGGRARAGAGADLGMQHAPLPGPVNAPFQRRGRGVRSKQSLARSLKPSEVS